jgi:NAD+ kinase
MKLFLVANLKKPRSQQEMTELVDWVKSRSEVVGFDAAEKTPLDQINADAIVVFGGDGTLLSTARRLRGRQIPVLGVNFGRLGFLASFTPAEFKAQLDSLLANKLPSSDRLMIETSLLDSKSAVEPSDSAAVAAQRKWHSIALNEAVVNAGAPFRMIELDVSSDDPRGNDHGGVQYFGDGVIVSTPSGSTAYNVAAGGPIISPGVEALCVTPVCPHSLAFRPIVVSATTVIHITAKRVNAGTTVSCDGQDSTRLNTGDRVIIRRCEHGVQVIDNPEARQWRTLAEKLHWAIGPNYRR